jgi:hypothetical protein
MPFWQTYRLVWKQMPHPGLGLIRVPFSSTRTLTVTSFLLAFCQVWTYRCAEFTQIILSMTCGDVYYAWKLNWSRESSSNFWRRRVRTPTRFWQNCKNTSKTKRIHCELFDSGWETYHENRKTSVTSSTPGGHLSTILIPKFCTSLVNPTLSRRDHLRRCSTTQCCRSVFMNDQRLCTCIDIGTKIAILRWINKRWTWRVW